jgi:ubiquinone biosynthesis protein UbiJ
VEYPAPGASEPEPRRQHLREAVEHLRAAGLPDLAQQVAQAGQQQLQAERRPPPGVPPEAVERIHAQLNELRQTVKRLQDQVEELSRTRK